jgi:FAD-dependent urate hydroxylase
MNVIDVAIIGAGPYGLSIAAHLRSRGISFRIFGEPMQFWREMPPSMFLKSNGSATNIYAPARNRLTFAEYSKQHGLEAFEPCAIADFARYGISVQKTILPEVEATEVIHVTGTAGCFEIALSNSEKLVARRVVVATGLKAFRLMPPELGGLPSEFVTHTCDHSTFDNFDGKTVFVIGAGQSALQAAALLHEAGAQVEVLVRKSKIDLASYSGDRRSLIRRIRWPKSRLGYGWKSWMLDTFPGAFYFVPDRWRIPFVRSFLGPSVAWWLRDRVTNKFPIRTNCSLLGAKVTNGRLTLCIHEEGNGQREVLCDHVVAGTGFEVDVERISFLDASLRRTISLICRAPRLNSRFQSSVQGLHFVGTMSALSFGPLFRFVVGADYTSRVLSRHFARAVSARTPALRAVLFASSRHGGEKHRSARIARGFITDQGSGRGCSGSAAGPGTIR